MQFVDYYSSAGCGVFGSELYFDPITYTTYERCYSTLWRVWHGTDLTDLDYADNEEQLEQQRMELMIQGRDISSQSVRDDARDVLSPHILPELLPVIDSYLLALHPETLIPVGRDVLMSWLTECDFTAITSPEALWGQKLIHDRDIGCCHFGYGTYERDGWTYDVEWCDDPYEGGFYEMSRLCGLVSSVPPIVKSCLDPPVEK